MSVQQTLNRFLGGLIEAPKALHRAAQWFVQSTASATPWLFGQSDAGASFPLGARFFTAAGDTSSRLKTDTKTGEGACSGSSGSPALTSTGAFAGMAVGHKVWIEGETGLFEVLTYADSSNITLDGNLTEDATNKRFVAWAEGEEVVLIISPMDCQWTQTFAQYDAVVTNVSWSTFTAVEHSSGNAIAGAVRDFLETRETDFVAPSITGWVKIGDYFYMYSSYDGVASTQYAYGGINLHLPWELADHSVIEIVEMTAGIFDNGGGSDRVAIRRQDFPTGASTYICFECSEASPTSDNGGVPVELDLKNYMFQVRYEIPAAAQASAFSGLSPGFQSRNGYNGVRIKLRRYGL